MVVLDNRLALRPVNAGVRFGGGGGNHLTGAAPGDNDATLYTGVRTASADLIAVGSVTTAVRVVARWQLDQKCCMYRFIAGGILAAAVWKSSTNLPESGRTVTFGHFPRDANLTTGQWVMSWSAGFLPVFCLPQRPSTSRSHVFPAFQADHATGAGCSRRHQRTGPATPADRDR